MIPTVKPTKPNTSHGFEPASTQPVPVVRGTTYPMDILTEIAPHDSVLAFFTRNNNLLPMSKEDGPDYDCLCFRYESEFLNWRLASLFMGRLDLITYCFDIETIPVSEAQRILSDLCKLRGMTKGTPRIYEWYRFKGNQSKFFKIKLFDTTNDDGEIYETLRNVGDVTDQVDFYIEDKAAPSNASNAQR